MKSLGPSTQFLHQFGFVLPTYLGDIALARRLVRSYEKYNLDNLPLLLVVEDKDFPEFQEFIDGTVTVMSYSSIPTEFAHTEIAGVRPGYLNQDIVKLAFHRTGIFRNYLCLDSDGLFIRNFYRSDFIGFDGTPYAILVEDKDLQADNRYWREYWKERQEALDFIWENLGGSGQQIRLTCHGFQIMRSEVLEKFELTFLKERGLSDFIDLYRLCEPKSTYLFSWYNYFLQLHFHDFQIREPLFRTFHSAREFLRFRWFGFTTEDWGRAYVGLVINSNFQHARGQVSPIGPEIPPSILAGSYLTIREAGQLVLHSLAALVLVLKRKLVKLFHHSFR